MNQSLCIITLKQTAIYQATEIIKITQTFFWSHQIELFINKGQKLVNAKVSIQNEITSNVDMSL